MKNKQGRIWSSVPHEVDGIAAELLEPFNRKGDMLSLDIQWFQTVAECRVWLEAQGAKTIEEI